MIAARADFASSSKCRPTMPMFAPSFASAMAVEAPIPFVPPVTRATFPERFNLILDFFFRRHHERFSAFAREQRVRPRMIQELLLIRIEPKERSECQFGF